MVTARDDRPSTWTTPVSSLNPGIGNASTFNCTSLESPGTDIVLIEVAVVVGGRVGASPSYVGSPADDELEERERAMPVMVGDATDKTACRRKEMARIIGTQGGFMRGSGSSRSKERPKRTRLGDDARGPLELISRCQSAKMAYNYSHLLSSIDPAHQASSSRRTTSPNAPRSPNHRSSSPVLLQPLPPSTSLTKESLAQSELELDRQTRQLQRERELKEALQEQEWEIQRETVRNDLGTWTRKNEKEKQRDVVSKGFVRPPQAYELYQAIDKHDIDFIMRVRDHSFGLLLQKNAGEFPIIYASRIGESHRDVVILLVGAMSRYVNFLEDEDFEKRETQKTLKALRANLKLAIDNALLPAFSSSLLSSYLQVLIMSEGDAWLHKAVYEISLIFRDPASHPAQAAEDMVRAFCTKELRGVKGGVSGVEEYVANAALDLLIMGCWSLVASQLGIDLLPTYTFARDLRTYQTFTEKKEENRGTLGRCSRRVKAIVTVLEDKAGDTRKSIRGRLDDVALGLDGDAYT
ncbi:hypothetical protein P7C73_g1486, partial [Tremellales sp. Uapishka_1]